MFRNQVKRSRYCITTNQSNIFPPNCYGDAPIFMIPSAQSRRLLRLSGSTLFSESS